MTQSWKEVSDHFAQVTDRLGKKIDGGILDTVVALNMLGIKTKQSCEGHLDWGVPNPWINLEPEIEQKYALHQLLSLFYAQRTAPFDALLSFQGYRLHSTGAVFVDLLQEEQKAEKLRFYQQEMAAFTTFLKSLLSLTEDPQHDQQKIDHGHIGTHAILKSGSPSLCISNTTHFSGTNPLSIYPITSRNMP